MIIQEQTTDVYILCSLSQGWKLALVHQPMVGKFYFGPVEILSGLVTFPITSIQLLQYNLWYLEGDCGVWELLGR